MNGVSMYHMALRVVAVTLALLLVFDSGLLLPATHELSKSTQQYLANTVGASARVEPNELNTLTAELTRQKKELDDRESILNERELAIGLNTGGTQSEDDNRSTYILSILLFIILVLIVLNYALDFARARRLSYIEQHG